MGADTMPTLIQMLNCVLVTGLVVLISQQQTAAFNQFSANRGHRKFAQSGGRRPSESGHTRNAVAESTINGGQLPDLKMAPLVALTPHWKGKLEEPATRIKKAVISLDDLRTDADALQGAAAVALVVPSTITEQRHLYQFDYKAPQHGHDDTGTEDGSKFGHYYVEQGNCWKTEVRYYADETGYHPRVRTAKIDGCEQKKREAAPRPNHQGNIQLREDPAVLASFREPQLVTEDGTPVEESYDVRRARTPQGAPADLPREGSVCSARQADVRPGKPYGFAYNAGTHYHWEQGFANGTKIGAYAVQTPDGKLRTTEYKADCDGFSPRTTIEPMDHAKFLDDFNQFQPPTQARLFTRDAQPPPRASFHRKPRLLRPNDFSKQEFTRSPSAYRRNKAATGAISAKDRTPKSQSASTRNPPPFSQKTTPEPLQAAFLKAFTTTTTPRKPTPLIKAIITPAPSEQKWSRGSRRHQIAQQLAKVVPVRPPGSGPYHFYIHLSHNYHEERGYPNGTVKGRYGVVAPDGILREVYYDSFNGFVPTLIDTEVGIDHRLCDRPSSL